MRVLSSKSLYPTKFAILVRMRSNLALAPINFTSSDSSSDEQQPTYSSHYNNSSSFDECLPHLDALKVAAVLRTTLRGQPKQALSFFYYGERGAGFQHNIRTYVEIFRILCSGRQRIHSRLTDIILEVVNSREVTLGFGISEMFQALVENIGGEEDNRGLLNRVSGAFVKSCARVGLFDDAVHVLFQTRRPPCIRSCNFLMNRLINHHEIDMAVALYRHLKSLGFLVLNIYTYNLLIRAYCRRGSLGIVGMVISEMEAAGIKPDEFTYSPLIEWFCSNGRSGDGYKALKALREENIAFGIFCYSVVIRGFSNEMNVSAAEDVLRYIYSQGLIPDAYCFEAMIRVYYKAGKFEEALLLYDEMLSMGVRTDCVMDAVFYNVVMDALCKSGKVEEAKRLFDEILAPDLIHYSTIINGHCREGNIVQAINLFGVMQSKGLQPDAILYVILLGALYRNDYVKKATNLQGFMQAQGLSLNSLTQKTIIEGLCVGGNVKEAETFFSGLEEIDTEVYSAMVSAYCNANHTMKAFELFSNLSQQGIVVDKKSQFKLQSKLLEGGHTQKAFRLYQSCLSLENEPCIKVCSKLMVAFCKARDMRNAKLVFDCWVERGLIPDFKMYTIMIDGYCKAFLMPEAYGFFNHMKARGIGADVKTYTVLIDGCVKSCLESPEFRTSSIMQKKKLDLDVTKLWTRMQEEMIEPDVVCYTVLIDKLCLFNDLDGAFVSLEEMMEREIKPDTVAFTALFCGCCRSGDVRALGLIDMIEDTCLADEMKEKDSRRVIFFNALQHGILHLYQHFPHLLSVDDLEKYMAIVKDFCKMVSVTD